MGKLRCAVLGAGYFSQFHFEAWRRMDDVDLVAVGDMDQRAATKAAQTYGIAATYSSIADLLDSEQPDFVDIVTRPDSHLSLVRECVARGTPMICQKPLAPDYNEAVDLVNLAKAADVPLMVHDNFRFQPWYREIKRLIADDTIGDRLHTLAIRTRTGDGWQPDAYLERQPYFRTMRQFLVYELGVHFIDTLRYLAGEIDGVYADLRNLNPMLAGEDAGIVLFEFRCGAKGLWDANRYNETNVPNPRYTFGDVLVEGSRGSIRLDGNGRIVTQRLGKPEVEHDYDCSKANFAGDCVFATQRHFVECLRDGRPFETDGEEYLKVLRVQEAVYRSAEQRLPIRGIHRGEEHADHRSKS